MAQLITIREAGQRKLLTAALGTTLIGSMASFAAVEFFPNGGKSNGGGASEEEQSGKESSDEDFGEARATDPTGAGNRDTGEADSDTPSSPVPDLAPTPTPSPSTPAVAAEDEMPACTMAPPPEFAAWAETNLGPRPNFACALEAKYPGCVADIQSRGEGATVGSEAAECARKITEFRRPTISKVYEFKDPYDRKIDEIAPSLSSPQTEIDQNRREYLCAEIKRLNGPQWQKFNALAKRSSRDAELCYSDARCGSGSIAAPSSDTGIDPEELGVCQNTATP
ncbi:hypothetical protein QWY75_11330 [Pontixanthobacter aestiaquae]|uniref:Uncharacterized protein n=1 Tax=Pontixanthobacter aestiaquae TaxID=1509367 RepID=A0A844Z2R3_9SPHN|nr:hypothetical protein [Pontixanthobacter aestiaquae]MDN3646793.1 hypothetical protein [Pontixanthobacter aestiaquae]MXO82225.1 hypothetical protein [Pontixanthobacter aestiaquae]